MNHDKLHGTVETTSRAQYQVLCPMFDTRAGLGNFIGAPAKNQPAINDDGTVWVLNIVKLQTYFLNKDYGFRPQDYEGENWERLVERVIPVLAGATDTVEFLNRLRIKVNVALDSKIEKPDPRKFLMQINMTRSQITPSKGRDAGQGSTAFPVIPTPGLLYNRNAQEDVVKQLFNLKDLPEKRLRGGD